MRESHHQFRSRKRFRASCLGEETTELGQQAMTLILKLGRSQTGKLTLDEASSNETYSSIRIDMKTASQTRSFLGLESTKERSI